MGRLSPQDIREREFKQSALGYSREQVGQFLEEVADELENLTQDFNTLHQEHKEAQRALQTYSNVEESLKEVLTQAKDTARDSVQIAREEANTIAKKAQVEKEALLFSAKEDLAAIQADIRNLRAKRDEMLTKLKSILRSNLDILNELHSDAKSSNDSSDDAIEFGEERIIDFSKADMAVEDLPVDNEESDIVFNINEDPQDE